MPAAFVDTDMARNIQAPDTSPEEVAAQTPRAIEEDREEMLAEALTRQVKSAVSAAADVYLEEAGR